jgi:hypothetical protein
MRRKKPGLPVQASNGAAVECEVVDAGFNEPIMQESSGTNPNHILRYLHHVVGRVPPRHERRTACRNHHAGVSLRECDFHYGRPVLVALKDEVDPCLG